MNNEQLTRFGVLGVLYALQLNIWFCLEDISELLGVSCTALAPVLDDLCCEGYAQTWVHPDGTIFYGRCVKIAARRIVKPKRRRKLRARDNLMFLRGVNRQRRAANDS